MILQQILFFRKTAYSTAYQGEQEMVPKTEEKKSDSEPFTGEEGEETT